MYDVVNYRMDCPHCGKDAGEFQTKDTGCLIEKVELFQISHFYALCDHCRTWIEFNRKQKLVDTVEDFDMTVQPQERRYNHGVGTGTL